MKLREIRQKSSDAGGMHAMLAPLLFVDDHVALTKAGDVFVVMELTGVDPECLEDAEIADVTQRFAAAMRSLGPEYRVYQYLLKQNSPVLSDPASGGPFEQRRADFLESRARELFTVRLFLVILRTRPQIDDRSIRSLLDRFSVRAELRISRAELTVDAHALMVAAASIMTQLRETVAPVLLDRCGVLGLLRRLVNCAPWKTLALSMFGDNIDQQMAQSSLECWKTYLEQDEYQIRMLSLVELPAQTFPHLLRGLLAVPSNAVMCSEWKREPNSVARREIDRRRRHYHLGKSSMLSYFGNNQPRPDEVLLDDSKAAVVDALNGALTEMEMNENYFGRFALTVRLFDQDPATLNRAVAKAAEVFATHDARLIEESYNLLNAYLSQIPGNYAYQQRWLWLLNVNYADLSFLFGPATGARVNPHLKAPALAILETEEKTPYYLNLHYQDVGHALILGAIGSGKSFLSNFVVASYQKYDPYTVIFDLGGSYRALTEEVHGSYQHVGKENAFTINPFALRGTAENLEFLFQFVRVLVERDGYEMSVHDREDLARCIGDLYELDPTMRRLGTLARTCHRSYRPRLAEWSGDGRLARYFDNERDTLTLAKFQTFDFEGMDQPDVLEATLFYILRRADQAIYSPAEYATPKLVLFDEAWKFFRHPATRDYIREALKTWRKRNAVMILATQSGDDLERSELLPVIAESAFTRMFLANPGMDPSYYRETFHLNSVEAAHVMRLQPKRQLLLKRPDGAKVLNLIVDEQSRRLFSIGGK